MVGLLSEAAALEALRLEFTRKNDADGLERLIAPDMIHIEQTGRVFSGADYVREVRSRGLTYTSDITMDQEEHRHFGDTYIAIGKMGGHARLEGEQQVFNLRYIAVWAFQGESWKLRLSQRTPILPRFQDPQNAWR